LTRPVGIPNGFSQNRGAGSKKAPSFWQMANLLESGHWEGRREDKNMK
jgi:hypothetical protein